MTLQLTDVDDRPGSEGQLPCLAGTSIKLAYERQNIMHRGAFESGGEASLCVQRLLHG